MENKEIEVKLADIKRKFHLKKLQHRSNWLHKIYVTILIFLGITISATGVGLILKPAYSKWKKTPNQSNPVTFRLNRLNPRINLDFEDDNVVESPENQETEAIVQLHG